MRSISISAASISAASALAFLTFVGAAWAQSTVTPPDNTHTATGASRHASANGKARSAISPTPPVPQATPDAGGPALIEPDRSGTPVIERD